MGVYYRDEHISVIDVIKGPTETISNNGVCDNAVAEPIIDLQISGNSVQESRLPSEYQEVEYLESAGTQYLVIDYIASGITKSKGKFQITDTTKGAFLFGSRNENSVRFYGFNWGGGRPYKYYNSYHDASLTTKEIDGEIHTFYKDKGDLYIDDVLIQSIYDKEFTTPSNMNIFACYSAGVNGYLPPYARIYNLQFYDNDILMVDLIPCYRKSDNIAGMYDIENNKFYTNAGTGKFVIGSNVPTPEAPIEVESAGERTINLYNRNEQKNISINTAYIGLDMRDWADDYYTLQIKLKEGKEIPADVYFGFIYLNTAAYWLLSNGSINTVYNGIVCASIENGLNGVCCFPSDKLDLILDAFDVFLVKGKFDANTIPEYEPYGYKVPVKVSGKNLFNGYNYINTNHNASINNDILLFYDNQNALNYPIYENENISKISQVTCSFRIRRTGNPLRIILNYTDDTNEYISLSQNDDFVEHIITSNPNKVIKDIRVNYNYSLPLEIDLLASQIEEGYARTNYEPYIEPVTTDICLIEPLRKIGEYVDYIDYQNKKVVRNVYRELITKVGSISSMSGTYTLFLSTISKKPFYQSYRGKCMSNKFAQTNQPYSALKNYGGNVQTYITSGGSYRTAYTFPDINITTVEQAQEKIGDGFEIYYVLETPIEEKIEMPTINTFDGTNMVEIPTEIEPSGVHIEYKSDGLKIGRRKIW